MTGKLCTVFLLLAMCALPLSRGQEAREKSAPQKAAPEKPATEKPGTDKAPAEKPIPERSPGGDWQQPALKAVELQPNSSLITLRMEGDSRAIYEAIGRQAGIKVVFDSDFIPTPARVDLNKVSLQDALAIVAAESRTFWRAVTSDTILIAHDSPAKRRELEQSIIKIFYLPNISAPTDMQDLVNALRTLLEIQRIQQLPSQNTILVRGTPNQIEISERLIDAMEKAKKKYGEYRLEFRISEMEKEKRLNSRTYALLIEQREAGLGKLRIGTRIPVQMSTDASDKKQIQYMDVGQNIDCQVRNESEHTVGLNIDVDFSNFAMSDQQGGGVGGSSATPVLQQFRITAKATLELGKPTIITSFDDPTSKRTFQIEVTAVRLRERE